MLLTGFKPFVTRSGSKVRKWAGDYRVCVSPLLPLPRARWVICHEIAEWHYLSTNYNELDLEARCDALGAALVLPHALFRAGLRHLELVVCRLAPRRLFGGDLPSVAFDRRARIGLGGPVALGPVRVMPASGLDRCARGGRVEVDRASTLERFALPCHQPLSSHAQILYEQADVLWSHVANSGWRSPWLLTHANNVLTIVIMVSQRVQEARSLSELSQRDLDRLAGLSEGHIGMIESGRRENLEAGTASRIAKVLGMTLEWLIDGTGEAPTVTKVKRAVASAQRAAAAARKVA